MEATHLNSNKIKYENTICLYMDCVATVLDVPNLTPLNISIVLINLYIPQFKRVGYWIDEIAPKVNKETQKYKW